MLALLGITLSLYLSHCDSRGHDHKCDKNDIDWPTLNDFINQAAYFGRVDEVRLHAGNFRLRAL